MHVLPGNACHIGQRRQQQDAFALSDFTDTGFISHGGYLAVLTDGVGGLLHGAEAAQIATQHFIESYLSKSCRQTVTEALDAALEMSNQAVCATARQNDCFEQMGTTLVAVVIHGHHLHWRSVGDSHLHLCRDRRLSQLNADHNFARLLQTQVEQGHISQQQADNHPERKALESFIGLATLPQIDRNQQPLPLKRGDILLLCSDGVDGVLSAEEIVDCLHGAPMLAAQRLCDAVLQKNQQGQDNLTAVVLAYQAVDCRYGGNSLRKYLKLVLILGTCVVLTISYLLILKYWALV